MVLPAAAPLHEAELLDASLAPPLSRFLAQHHFCSKEALV